MNITKDFRPCVLEVINFLRRNNSLDTQMFNSKNIASDPMETVYNKNGIRIDYCYRYEYYEIFGLTDDEFEFVSQSYYLRNLDYEIFSNNNHIMDILKNLSLKELESFIDAASKSCHYYICTYKDLLNYIGIKDEKMINDFEKHVDELL